jgi:calcium-dependent protein kinase
MKDKDYLNDYDIVKKIIGKGGFGLVRKVKSKYTLGTRVAKCIKKNLMKPEDISKLFTELYIMKMLDHPNIIKLYEVYDYNDEFVLIL